MDRARWQNYANQKINVPTHIIHGELDPVIVKEFLFKAETAFEYPIEITYLKGGHFICDEQPEEVAHVLQKFLTEWSIIKIPCFEIKTTSPYCLYGKTNPVYVQRCYCNF